MPDKINSTFWDAHQNQIKVLSKHRAFLMLELREETEFSNIDGSLLRHPLQNWMEAHAIENFFLLLNRQREEFWKQPVALQNYQELICFHVTLETVKGCVWKENIRPAAEIEQLLKTTSDKPLEKIAAQQHAAVLCSHHPLLLEAVHIAKPWGYEEWYSGVEQRGVAKVRVAEDSTELPYALSLFRHSYLRDHPENLILLKTLNPVAEDILGDLYLEMHEEKWEAYVVTEIDPNAWPSGVGIIKAGLNEEKVTIYQQHYGKKWTQPYLQDFERHITKYEQIRRRIDQQMDAMRKRAGIDLLAPLTPELTQQFLKNVPEEEQKEEKQSRDKLYSFIGDYPVRVGDIVSFSTHQIHSLQHGIRVIEFQTPHYERLIVMFTQKVLTQPQWNTTKALSVMKAEVYQSPPLVELGETGGWHNERFVDFPEFTADRIIIQPQNEYSDQSGDAYHLLMGVRGEGTICSSAFNAFPLQTGEGIFLPASLQDYTIRNASSIPLIYLKAMPKN